MKSTPFEVYIRIRPVGSGRANKRCISVEQSKSLPTSLNLLDPLGLSTKHYTYNGIFTETSSTTEVYSLSLQKLIPRLSEGLNATCFAYGSTGAGKTHTMFGHSNATLGIASLSISDCLNLSKTSIKKVSFLEIYNETVVDLLGSKKALMIVEDPIRGVVVPELAEVVVSSIEEVYGVIARGGRNRAKAPTGANEFSTRSHAVLQILVQTEGNVGKMSLIDLAGSERAAGSENRGIRMKEGANINRSLLALGNCINVLSDPKKKGAYVPFRDSKLTRLLKESLGGNSMTVMIACVSPLQNSYEDTCQTLKYAARAKNIVALAEKSVKTVNYVDIISSLKSEIEVLRIQLSKNTQNPPSGPSEVHASEGLSQQIVSNFEEHWELKQAIREIEDLNKANENSLNDTVGDEKKRLLQCTIHENESRKSLLLQALYVNLKQKKIIENQIAEVKDDSKRELLELQIQVRSLKLEKIDLFVANSAIKIEAEQAKREVQEKDLIISQMRAEIDSMRCKIRRHESVSNISSANLSPINNPSSEDQSRIIMTHKPHHSLQQARFINKNKIQAKRAEKGSIRSSKDQSPVDYDEDEEGRVNTPMIIATKLRQFSISGAENKICKPGCFSGLQSFLRNTSIEKLNTTNLAHQRSRKILEKKDLNVINKSDNCIQRFLQSK